MRFVPKGICFVALLGVMAVSSTALSQVLVMDNKLNLAVAENNKLIGDLLHETSVLSSYTEKLYKTVGDSENSFAYNIRYPSDLLAPRVLDELGLDEKDYNRTILSSPLALEAMVENYIMINPEYLLLEDADFQAKFGVPKDTWKDLSSNRRAAVKREAVLEGYAIAYIARVKSASTGRFLNEELMEKARNSTGIRGDLEVENLALAEIIGQLGTLVAVTASELEMDAAAALNSTIGF